ncbi:MAG: acyl-CoA desaturase [Candidatus Peregrinibacteria bacterium]|nr:acyl-CoA desaturase [Candidatus Peregrinibacteria bacterium]
MQGNTQLTQMNYYPLLRAQIVEKGLLEKKPISVLLHLILAVTLLGLSIVCATLFPPLSTVVFAVVGGFGSLLLGYVMHDGGHRQCSRDERVNNLFGWCATVFLGTSLIAWMDVHNAHHNQPNHEDDDPDVTVPFVAYSQKQVHSAQRRPYRWFIAHQTWFYVLLLSLVPYSKRYYGLYQLMLKKEKTAAVCLDLAIVLLWHVYYYGGLWFLFGFWNMLLFTSIHQAALGIFFGMVFAPNHKGMPIIERGEQLDFFTRQVITSRNMHPNPITDFLYGGLNYQIEHHLFPHMPRYNLARAKVVVEKFCKEHGVPYYETTIMDSYREVYRSLREIADYARSQPATVAFLREKLTFAIENAQQEVEQFLEKSIHQQLDSVQYESLKRTHDLACERLTAIRTRMMQASEQRKERLQEYYREVQALVQRMRSVAKQRTGVLIKA